MGRFLYAQSAKAKHTLTELNATETPAVISILLVMITVFTRRKILLSGEASPGTRPNKQTDSLHDHDDHSVTTCIIGKRSTNQTPPSKAFTCCTYTYGVGVGASGQGYSYCRAYSGLPSVARGWATHSLY